MHRIIAPASTPEVSVAIERSLSAWRAKGDVRAPRQACRGRGALWGSGTGSRSRCVLFSRDARSVWRAMGRRIERRSARRGTVRCEHLRSAPQDMTSLGGRTPMPTTRAARLHRGTRSRSRSGLAPAGRRWRGRSQRADPSQTHHGRPSLCFVDAHLAAVFCLFCVSRPSRPLAPAGRGLELVPCFDGGAFVFCQTVDREHQSVELGS